MTKIFDVVIVGSGPSGVSAAFPLLEAGLNVLMVDGGRQPAVSPPDKPFLHQRAVDGSQWKWMVGEDFYALRQASAISPKLRVPTHSFVFERFEEENRIEAPELLAIGSLASGGLSNAWGCGVARLSSDELADYPLPPQEFLRSYEIVSRRIGLSGANDDALSDYFGVDEWAEAPIPIDRLQETLFERYRRRRDLFTATGFHLGRSRVAALSRDHDDRQSCDLSGNCLYGCSRGALYSALEDLKRLKQYPNFSHRPGTIVDAISRGTNLASLTGRGPEGPVSLQARRMIVAAGTLATTRLILQALDHRDRLSLQSSPTAAFVVIVPRFLGQRHQPAFGLGQLSFVLDLDDGLLGYGSLFNPAGIPIAEFSRHLPMLKSAGIDVLGSLLSACAVGNFFLPGHLTRATVHLAQDRSLKVEGTFGSSLPASMAKAQRRLRSHFLRLGALVLPRSFRVGKIGSDIHYSCTLPMRAIPTLGETTPEGEVIGLEGIHVADGACLPALPAKPHTLTIMANADRIGRRLAARLR